MLRMLPVCEPFTMNRSVSRIRSPSPGFAWGALRVLGAVVFLGFALSRVSANSAGDPPVSEVVAPGVTAYHGKKFFPLGFYHVRTPGDVDKIADAGFNACEVIYERDEKRFRSVLDRAAERGVAVIAACRSEDVVAEKLVDRYRGHKAIFMWNAEDDHDDEAYRTFDQVKAKAEGISRKDPERLVYVSATGYFKNRRDRAREWLSFADVPGIQSYPIAPKKNYSRVTEGASALLDNYQKIRLYVEAAPGKPVLANLQTFAWGEGGRMPTMREIRAMTYGALVAGVDGILFYEFRTVKDDPAYWDGLTKLGAEIRKLKDVFLSMPMRELETNSETAVASAWVGDGDAGLLIVTSVGEKAARVSVTLPAGFETGNPRFPGGGGSLDFMGRRLTGTLVPGSAQVYTISRAR